MTDNLPCYEVYALRYARMTRPASHNFILHDAHDGTVEMDFYVWLIKLDDTAILVDTGFGERGATQRGRPLDCCPIDALRHLGVRSEQIRDVILTHLHWDHAGNLDKLPNARFHLQEARSRSRMSASSCTGCTKTASSSTMATTCCNPASNCCASAAIPKGCRRCGCIRRAGG